MDRLGNHALLVQLLAVVGDQDETKPLFHAFLSLLFPQENLMTFHFHDFLYGFPMDLIVPIFVLVAV